MVSWNLACLTNVALFWPIWAELARRWLDLGGYTHGPLVVAMFVWAARTGIRRDSYPMSTPRTSQRRLGLLLLAGLAAIASLFAAARFEMGAEAMLPMLIAASAFVMFEYRLARSLAAAALLLYFTIPVWEPLGEPLRQMTVTVASKAIELAGWPAFIEGSTIYLPDGIVEVAEGCSGLKYFVAACCVAYFIAYTAGASALRGVLVVFSFAVAAIVANWVRVTALVGIAYQSAMQSSLMESHNTFGWVLFGLFLLPLILVADRLARPLVRRSRLQA